MDYIWVFSSQESQCLQLHWRSPAPPGKCQLWPAPPGKTPAAIMGWWLHKAPGTWQPGMSPQLPPPGTGDPIHPCTGHRRQQCPWCFCSTSSRDRQASPTHHTSELTNGWLVLVYCQRKGSHGNKMLHSFPAPKVNEVSWNQGGNENGTKHFLCGVTARLALGLFSSAKKKRETRKWSLGFCFIDSLSMEK